MPLLLSVKVAPGLQQKEDFFPLKLPFFPSYSEETVCKKTEGAYCAVRVDEEEREAPPPFARLAGGRGFAQDGVDRSLCLKQPIQKINGILLQKAQVILACKAFRIDFANGFRT